MSRRRSYLQMPVQNHCRRFHRMVAVQQCRQGCRVKTLEPVQPVQFAPEAEIRESSQVLVRPLPRHSGWDQGLRRRGLCSCSHTLLRPPEKVIDRPSCRVRAPKILSCLQQIAAENREVRMAQQTLQRDKVHAVPQAA